jgi:multiple sugar transport system permease protein
VNPTVRSRLWAAGTAFLLGFVVANVGILAVTGVDRWLWLAVAVVLMLTGAVGVLVADTRRRLSLWAVLGLELAVVGTVAPLWWTVALALTPGDVEATSLLPADARWSVFGDVLRDGALREAAVTSVVAATVVTVVAMLLSVPAAYALARRRVAGGRAVPVVVVAVLLVPLVALAGPWADTADALGLLGSRWAVVVPLLLVALPLALLLTTPVLRDAPWSLRDSIRSDGADRRQEVRAFVVPVLLPDLVVVAALVWVVAAQDVVLGAALGPTTDSRTLPATLLLGSVEPARAAAVGLLWLLPVLVLVAVAPRRVRRLIGRDHP